VAEFSPASLGIAERAALLNALVAPRPVAFVSTVGADGRGNLAPFSFFMAAGYAPMAVAFSATNWRDGAPKDTLRNVEATGEFVVSVSTRAMAERLNQASYRYAYGEDEFDHPDNRKIEHLVRLGGDWFASQGPATLFALRRPEAP